MESTTFLGFRLAAHGLSVLVKFIFGSGLKEKENQGEKDKVINGVKIYLHLIKLHKYNSNYNHNRRRKTARLLQES
jgi:hypothetical protein